MSASYPFQFASIVDLEALGVAAGITVQTAWVYGEHSGMYEWNAASTDTPVAGRIVQATGVTTGRFIRNEAAVYSLYAYAKSGLFASDQAALVACDSDAAAAGAVAVLDYDITLTANTALTATWRKFGGGGVITRSTHTLSGDFWGVDGAQMFDVSGTGAVTITGSLDVYAEWFGFGATQTAVNNLAALRAAAYATPSGGRLLSHAGGYVPIAADPTNFVELQHRMEVDLSNVYLIHDGVTNGALYTIFNIRKNGATTPAFDLNYNGQLEHVYLKANIYGNRYLTPPTNAAGSDNRTSTFNFITLDGGTDDVMVKFNAECFIGSALYFSGANSVRESVFEADTIRYCGNQTAGYADIHINPVGAGGDGHNELTFIRGRQEYSFSRKVYIVGGAATAAQQTRILHFKGMQFENDEAVAPTWQFSPPNIEEIWIEQNGEGGVTFEGGEILNPYSVGTANWGAPCIRLGNIASGYAAQDIRLVDMWLTSYDGGGVGVLCENVDTLKISGSSKIDFQVGQNRAIVVGAINYSGAYGTVTAPSDSAMPYIYIDPTVEITAGIYFPDVVSRNQFIGQKSQYDGASERNVIQANGGFISGFYNLVVATTGAKDLDLLSFMPYGVSRNALVGSTWLVKGFAVNYTSGDSAEVSFIVSCHDQNRIANITQLTSSNTTNLAMTATTYGGLTAASVSSANGGKFRINFTNGTGSSTQPFWFTATNLGAYVAPGQ